MANLQSKKIFVTGGSRGIGAATVRFLAERGAQVAFSYASREESAQEVLKSLKGSGHFLVKMDLTQESSIEAACSEVAEKFGELDGLVNNAGLTKDTLILRMKAEDFDQVIQANLRGCFLTTKFFVKSMIKARKGSIVNITSVIGQTGNAGQCNYAASKAGIEAMTKSVAQEVASRGVRLNCVAPGFIATDMTGSLTEDQKKSILAKVPMERMAEPAEVASSIAFLLSDDSKYITGHTLSVNGGLYMN